MAHSDIFQQFRSRKHESIVNIPAFFSLETGKYCVLWADIEDTFEGVDSLTDFNKQLVPFAINSNGELCSPLCIAHQAYYSYRVIYSDNMGDRTIDPEQHLHKLFQKCSGLFQDLQNKVLKKRNGFQQLSANYRYYNALLTEELRRPQSSNGHMPVSGKDWTQMLTEVQQQEQQLIRWDYQNACRQILSKVNNRLDYSAPTLFIVLPWKQHTWNRLDRSTHRFRLYFLCHNKNAQNIPAEVPQHIHLASHPGYDLIRPQEFFQKYGYYALCMLKIIKLGYSDEFNTVPALDTLMILPSGCSDPPDEIPRLLSSLEPLIDHTIAYLSELPKSNTELEMTRGDGDEIRRFLHVPDEQSPTGDLHYYTDRLLRVSWVCKDHAYQHLDSDCLQELQEFVNTHDGYLNVQQAVLKVDLESTTDVDQFLALLINTKYSFNISIKLNWTVSRTYLEEICREVDESYLVRLGIEGVAISTHSRDPVHFSNDMFADIISSVKIKFITLINYPRLQQHCYYIGDCSFLSSVSPIQLDIDWVGLRDVLRSFNDSVSAETATVSNCKEASTGLQSVLANGGFLDVIFVTVHRKNWNGTFDVHVGALVDLHSPHLRHPRSLLNPELLQRLTLDLVDLEAEQDVYRMVQSNRGLQELNISIQEKDVLYIVEHIARLWSIRKSSLRLTLFEYADDNRGRIISQAVLEGKCGRRPENGVFDEYGYDTVRSNPHAKDMTSGIDFLEWNHDYSLSPTSDYSASLLDIATQQYPLNLTSFALDISLLSDDGLHCIQNFFHRSNLEHLRVMCTPFDPCLSVPIVQLLGAVPWSTLKSLTLSGYTIDEWIHHWTPVTSSQLLQLNIQPSGPDPLELSHTSVLFIHQLAYLSPLVDVHFENVEFKDKHDWALIADSLDPSLLEIFGVNTGCGDPPMFASDANGSIKVLVQQEGR